MWLTTLHLALEPHAPGHGSRHFWFTHARTDGHSGLMVHSGRQLGGAPIKPETQEQAGDSPRTTHSAFGPQGDGTQGLVGAIGSAEIVGRNGVQMKA